MMGLLQDLLMGSGNEVENKNGFYISYAQTASGDTEDETAIVVEKKGRNYYYILNGDHRKEYSKIKTLRGCMSYFKKNKHLKSSWSN